MSGSPKKPQQASQGTGRAAHSLPIAVVVLNWNGLELSRACLRSWKAARPAPRRILLVDNGSQDASVATLKREFKGIEVLALPKNLGFAAGNNKGFEALWARGSKVEAVFICNNDTEVQPDMLAQLWQSLQAQSKIGVVGPRILFHSTGRIWFEGACIRSLSGRPQHLGYDAPAGIPGSAFELPARGFVTGCGMLVRSDLLKALGGFDASFWAYAEDSDLCLRARTKGYGSAVQPSAVMSHKVSASFGLESALSMYYITRNSLWLMRRHSLGVPGLSPLLFSAWSLARSLRSLLRGHGDAAASTLRGLRDGLLNPVPEAP